MIGRCLTPEMILSSYDMRLSPRPTYLHRHSLRSIKSNKSFLSQGCGVRSYGGGLVCPHWPRQLSLHEYDAFCLIVNRILIDQDTLT